METDLIESTSGNVAGNISQVFDNGDSITSRTLDSFAIESKQDTIISNIGNLNNINEAQVLAKVSEALVAIGLDHLLSASVTGSDVIDDSIIAKLVSKSATADFDDYNNTTDSLQAIRDRGDAYWITASLTGIATSSEVSDVLTAIGDLNDFDYTTQQVTVATNNDKTGYSITGTLQNLDDVVENLKLMVIQIGLLL